MFLKILICSLFYHFSSIRCLLELPGCNSILSLTDLPYRPSSHAVTGSRVPQTQILIQMASMLTEQIQATAEGELGVLYFCRFGKLFALGPLKLW